ncbi:hypothetical protein D3C80_1850470 [compost metagenome]
MRHCNASTDTRAGLGFARQNLIFEQLLVVDPSAGRKTGYQFINRRFLRCGLQVHDHCIFYQQICNSHVYQLPKFL